jgi:SAM-dependent methyltransferase
VNLTGSYDDSAFVADFYDHVAPYRARQDVAFFVEVAKEAGGPVLEIGCGTGRVLLPIARAGVEIVGLDSSSEMLRVCREKLAREPTDTQRRVQLVNADMRDFQLSGVFAVAMMPFRPFQHLLTVADQCSCLTCVGSHLPEGGELVMDVFNPSLEMLASDDVGEELGDEPEFLTPGGARVVRRYRVISRDLHQQINHVELIYYVSHPDGREDRLVHAFPMRYLFRFELEHLLARCGFVTEHVYADFERSPYGSKYPGDLVVVARKGDTRES